MNSPIIELRWADNGELEYRTRPLRIDAWGDLRGLDDWTDWQSTSRGAPQQLAAIRGKSVEQE